MSSKKKTTPLITSAAGLVRFFEETDLKFAIKPHLIILAGFIFVTVVIVLSRLIPLT